MNSSIERSGKAFRRDVGPGDPQRIRDLVAATGFFSAEEIEIAEGIVRETLERGESAGYEFLFADADDGTAGYSCFGRIPCTLASWDLYWIAVAPSAQGSGLGRRLLQETEAIIETRGGAALYAETSGRSQYAPTRAFYQRCGYACAAVFDDFYGPGDDKCVFVKKLRESAPPSSRPASA